MSSLTLSTFLAPSNQEFIKQHLEKKSQTTHNEHIIQWAIDIADKLKEYSVVNSDQKIHAVKFHKSNNLWIFEIDSGPELIFKMPPNEDVRKKFFKSRCVNIEFAKKIRNENQLLKLIIPEANIVNKDLNLLAEKKLKLLDWKDLYTIYTKEDVLESLKQFTIFVCKTGLADTHNENYQFLADGSGIGLYDLETMYPPEFLELALKTFIIHLPQGDFFEPLKEVIRNNIASNVFQKLFK